MEFIIFSFLFVLFYRKGRNSVNRFITGAGTATRDYMGLDKTSKNEIGGLNSAQNRF